MLENIIAGSAGDIKSGTGGTSVGGDITVLKVGDVVVEADHGEVFFNHEFKLLVID